MASRKMTFTIPEEVATQFLRRVPARNRSRYISEALAAKLQEREERLIRACEVANRSAEVQTIEQEWDALADNVEEPWDIAPPR